MRFLLSIGHIHILGIGLELACNGGLCGLIFSHVNHTKLFLMILPRISLHCKLDPVQYREYKYGLLLLSDIQCLIQHVALLHMQLPCQCNFTYVFTFHVFSTCRPNLNFLLTTNNYLQIINNYSPQCWWAGQGKYSPQATDTEANSCSISRSFLCTFSLFFSFLHYSQNFWLTLFLGFSPLEQFVCSTT